MGRFLAIKRHAGVIALACAGVLLLSGIGIFLIAFRSIEMTIAPGDVLEYRMTTVVRDLDAAGRPGPERSEQRSLWLIGLGSGGGADRMLLCRDARSGHQVEMLAVDPDGQVRLLDAAGRSQESGPRLGLFDLNLLRLPPDQAARNGKVTVTHAVLPPGRRQVQASVKRTKAGASSVFLLRFIDQVPWVASDGRYRTLRDLTCEFTVDGMRGRVTTAEAKAGFDIELPEPASVQRRLWSCTWTLVGVTQASDDVTRLMQTAQRVLMLEEGVATQRAQAAQGLRYEPVACPPLAQGVSAALARWQRPVVQREAATNHFLVIESQRGSRAEADRMAATLRGLGHAARSDSSANRSRVLLGPLPSPDPAVASQVQSRLQIPPERMRWMEAR